MNIAYKKNVSALILISRYSLVVFSGLIFSFCSGHKTKLPLKLSRDSINSSGKPPVGINITNATINCEIEPYKDFYIEGYKVGHSPYYINTTRKYNLDSIYQKEEKVFKSIHNSLPTCDECKACFEAGFSDAQNGKSVK